MDYLTLAGRLIIGFIFVAAATGKIADPEAFAQAILNYKVVSGTSVLVFATILPWMELLAGLGVFFGVATRGSSLILSGTLMIFTVAVASAVMRGLDISCGCFSADPAVGKVGWTRVGENLLMLAVAIFLFCSKSTSMSFEKLLLQRLAPNHGDPKRAQSD
jgi:uncharacterized membrane protein YphA (DoxX/SURF4 family)